MGADLIQLKSRSLECFNQILFISKISQVQNLTEMIKNLTKDLYEWPERLNKEMIAMDKIH